VYSIVGVQHRVTVGREILWTSEDQVPPTTVTMGWLDARSGRNGHCRYIIVCKFDEHTFGLSSSCVDVTETAEIRE